MKSKLELNSDAEKLRMEFKLDPYARIDVFSICGNLPDLTMVFRPFWGEISGMCAKTSDEKVMIINSASSYGRQRFTAAHELYHLYVQDNFTNSVCKTALDIRNNPAEIEANQFASYFLAPYNSLDRYLSEKNIKRGEVISLLTIIEIEQYYQMSREALLRRLKNEGYKYNEIEATKEKVRTAALYGFPTELYFSTPEEKQYFTYGHYIKLAGELKNKKIISDGKYEELLIDAYRDDIVSNQPSEVSEVND